MKLKFSLLIWILAAIVHAGLLSGLSPDRTLVPGLIALTLTGLLLLFKLPRKSFSLSKVGKKGFSLALVLILVLAGCIHLPVFISYKTNWVSFTYGSGGLEANFIWPLLKWLMFYACTVFLGIEIFFRVLAWNSLRPHATGTSATTSLAKFLGVSASAYTLWIIPLIWKLLEMGTVWAVGMLFFRELTVALIAGMLFYRFKSLWISGLWVILASYPRYFIISDYDSTLTSAFYLVSGSKWVYGAQIIGCLVAIGLCLPFSRKSTWFSS